MQAPARDLTLRPLRRDDLDHVASLHAAAFRDSSMTSLGHEALRRYYLWLLEGPHQATVLGVFDGARLVGYSFSGVFDGALTGFLRANRGYLALRVATRPWLVANPLFRDNIALAVRLLTSRAKPAAAAKPKRAPPYGILAIAVDPTRQGQGIGQQLMARNEEVARAAGYEQMRLSVTPANTSAVRFYERGGWEREIVDGAWSRGVMTKRLA